MNISPLGVNKVLENPVSNFSKNDSDKNLLANKVQELVEVIEKTVVDVQTLRSCQQQIEDAIKRSTSTQKKLAPFQKLDEDNNLSREELLEGLEKLLAENQIDSKISSSFTKRNTLQKVIVFIISIILIVAGFAMIIMPAPPSFEIFTVYYFNINDGITVMDLFSLLIIFGGILLFVLNFNKK